MRFLLTNDDGIESVFLHYVVEAFLEQGHEVYVAAPRTEQSWIGAAKSRARIVATKRSERDFGCPAWTIDGTPADCVNIALDHLVPKDVKLDGVVSGMNVGMNATLGFIIASGTIGGALEGALHGLPSAALSQNLSDEVFMQVKHNHGHVEGEMARTLRHSARHAARMVPALLAETGRGRFIVHNLNFPYPCNEDSETRRSVPAHVVVPKLFVPAAEEGSHRMEFSYGEDLSPKDLVTDRGLLAQGKISHSILDYTRLGMPA
jgi:5'-nucleotidase